MGLWTAWAPLIAGAFGPDPLRDRAAYRSGPLSLFAKVDTGRDAAHHIPSRAIDPVHALVQAAASRWPAGSEGDLDMHELWLDDPTRCRWTDQVREGGAIVNDWPFLFHGFMGVLSRENDPEGTIASTATLWVGDLKGHYAGYEATGRDGLVELGRSCLGSARALFAEHLGVTPAEIEVVEDPGQTMISMNWYVDTDYLRVSLVYPRDPPGTE